MTEPNLTPDAITAITEYSVRLARSTRLPYADAEDARRELAAHVTDLAQAHAAQREAATGGPEDVESAVRAMGPDDVVLAAFFAPAPATHATTANQDWRRRAPIILAVAAGASTLMAFVTHVIGGQLETILLILSLFGLSTLGSVAVWRWAPTLSIAPAMGVFVIASLGFAYEPNDPDALLWFLPATLIFVGGILKLGLPTGTASGRLSELSDYVAQNWRRLAPLALAAFTVLLTAVAFFVSMVGGMWIFGVGLIALALFGTFAVGRLKPWIPFMVAGTLFVAPMLLYDIYGDDDVLAWMFPAVALAATALLATLVKKQPAARPQGTNVQST